MRILAIESSCDETSASVVESTPNQLVKVLSLTTSSSVNLHAATGGIIPEQAAREQIKYIIPVVIEALIESKNSKLKEEPYKTKFTDAQKILKEDIDALAVTYGPGLIGSLLVGVETAKTFSYVFNKPLIPVHHLLAHLYANFIESSNLASKYYGLRPNFPFLGLIVSGGHTDLLLFESHKKYTWLGGTRDDAAGEAFDKIGRLLGFDYPAGAEIERRAKSVTSSRFTFKSPMLHSDDFDFSFSGLKTEVQRDLKKVDKLSENEKNEVCFAVQKAIVDVLVKKTLKAAKQYNVKSILIGGGVSANQTFCNQLKLAASSKNLEATILFPERKYSTDNAAMIGAWAALNPEPTDWRKVEANPELYFD